MTRFVQPEKIEIDANERAVNEKSPYCFFVCTTFDSFLNDLSTRNLKALIKEKLNINAIATSVKPDIDASALPDNPEDEEELYKEADAIDNAMSKPEEIQKSEESEELQKEQEEQPTEKVKLRLMFTGGSEMSDTQIVFLNKFLTTQPKNKKLKLVFIEEN